MDGHYSEGRFWRKLWLFAVRAGRELVEKALILYYAAQHPATPPWAKATIYGALAYFINPFDAIPDIVPAVGFTDDLAVIVAAIGVVALYITPDSRARARAKAQDIFGESQLQDVKHAA